MDESGGVIKEIKKKIKDLREKGFNLYPSGFKRDTTVEEVICRFGSMDNDALKKVPDTFTVAGRIMSVRNFGKAVFIHIKDGTGQLQAYIRKDRVGEENFKIFSYIDIGDHIGVKGQVFRTKTNELTLLASSVVLYHWYASD